jgi:hypothetical protein
MTVYHKLRCVQTSVCEFPRKEDIPFIFFKKWLGWMAWRQGSWKQGATTREHREKQMDQKDDRIHPCPNKATKKKNLKYKKVNILPKALTSRLSVKFPFH